VKELENVGFLMAISISFVDSLS